MRHPAVLLAVAALVGCANAGNKPADSTPAAAATAQSTQSAPIRLADVAGTWKMTGRNAANDSTLVTYELVATPDTTGWLQRSAGKPDIPVRVTSVAGDSIVLDVGPYESMLRKGVQVTTHSVNRLANGKFVGTLVAHYRSATSDSVLSVNTEGVKAP